MARCSFRSRVQAHHVAAGLALAALSLGGCGGGSPTATPSTSQPSTSQQSSQPSTSQSPTAAGGRYKIVDDLCKHVDLDAATELLPYVEGVPKKEDGPNNAMLCSGTLGVSKSNQGAFTVSVEVFEGDNEARNQFKVYYDNNVMLSSVTDVGGIGQKAYQFVVPVAGRPTVKVLDGNAVISCDWYPSSRGSVPPDGLFKAMIETIRGTMASLQKA